MLKLKRKTELADTVLHILAAMEAPQGRDDSIEVYPFYRRLDPKGTPGAKEYGWSVVNQKESAEHDRGVTFCESAFTNLILVYYGTDPQYLALDPFYKPEKVIEMKYPAENPKLVAEEIYGWLFQHRL